MVRFVLILLAASLFAGTASAQVRTLNSEKEIRSFAETVMSHAAKMDYDGIVKTAQAYSSLPEEEMKALIGQIKLQMNAYVPRFGKAVGYEFIKEEQVGASVIRLTFIAKHENHALPWRFVFYKSPSGWMLNQFFFNDNLNMLF